MVNFSTDSKSSFRRAAANTRRRYNRLAPVYDLMEGAVERGVFAGWRQRLWSRVSGGSVLEVGVGTGKNMPYYPDNAAVTAIDLSPGMLRRAAQRRRKLGSAVRLCQMTAEALAFPARTFDAVIATFVLCSVPDPIAALRELARVSKPTGTILLLEHVRVDRLPVGPLMDLANPVVVRLTGANINRRTVENVRQAGLELATVENLSRAGLVKLITASPTR